MFERREYFELKKSNGTRFYIKPSLLRDSKEQLEFVLQGEPYLHTLTFARRAMFFQEIQSNNQVEGYMDDLETIRSAIKNAEAIDNSEKKARILNLYHAYQYILNADQIDKESLRKLYSIISKDLLSLYDRSNMGDYYRTKPVYILKCGKLNSDVDEGVPVDYIDRFMDAYFEFLEGYDTESETDDYIKSQILHFYFVYIHPYFDVNGRTSRTLAMWYLLNKKAYPYIIFNRGISFRGSNYDRAIIKSKETNDMTHFIRFMLETVEQELEKEYVIHTIESNSQNNLSVTDYQTLLYLMSMKGLRSVLDFATFYNARNNHKDIEEIYGTMLEPLLDRGILDVETETKREVRGMKNKVLTLRPLDVDPNKVKNLNLWQ